MNQETNQFSSYASMRDPRLQPRLVTAAPAAPAGGSLQQAPVVSVSQAGGARSVRLVPPQQGSLGGAASGVSPRVQPGSLASTREQLSPSYAKNINSRAADGSFEEDRTFAGEPSGAAYGFYGYGGTGTAGVDDLGALRGAKRPIPLTKGLFLSFGLAALSAIVILPIWDSILLMQNFVYTHWHAIDVQLVVLCCCIAVLVIFVLVVETMLRRAETVSTQTMVMVTALFVSLLGVLFILTSMPVSARSLSTYNDIIFSCDVAPSTRDLRAHYLDLLLLRETEGCITKESVEDCDGYQSDGSNTKYLKNLEEKTRCSGFCVYEDPALSLVTAAPAAIQVSLESRREQQKHDAGGQKNKTSTAALRRTPVEKEKQLKAAGRQSHGAQNATAGPRHQRQKSAEPTAPLLALPAKEASLAAGQKKRDDVWFPPTLFSTSNFQVSCSGNVAREMKNVGSDVANHLWRLGISLLAVSLLISMFEITVIAAAK